MKILRLMTMWVLLMAAAQMSAEKQYIYADPVTIEAGGEAEIVVKIDLDTDSMVSDWFFLLKLPDGIDVTFPDDPVKSCALSTELTGELKDGLADKILNVYDSENHRLLFYAFMLKNSVFIQNPHGELCRVAIKSTLAEALTFTPDIFYVHISSGDGTPLVIEGVLQKLPDHGNTLYANDVESFPGSEFTLSVKMRNNIDIEGFAFDLFLPPGMSVVTDADGNLMVSLSEERSTSTLMNTFSVVKFINFQNESIRVIAASSNGSAISPGDGEVCTVRVRVGTGITPYEYPTVMKNISLADTDAVSHDMDEMWFNINVLALAIGDANGDSNVTVADLTAIAHHILGNTPEGFSPKAADANQDGQVNVADYTAVAHLLLYGNIYGPAESRAGDVAQGRRTGTEYPVVTVSAPTEEVTDVSALDNAVYIAPVKAAAGEELTLSVRMKNAVDAEGFQFTLCLPEGVSVVRDADGFAVAELSTERTTRSRTNTFASSLHSDGTLHVMAASTNGSAIAAGDGEVCKVNVRVAENIDEGSYDIVLKDIAISDTSARSHGVASVTAALTVADAAGIADIVNLASDNVQPLYDLQGRRIAETPCKGVYIRDGRKYVK